MSNGLAIMNTRKSVILASLAVVLCCAIAIVLLGKSGTSASSSDVEGEWLNVTGTVPLPGDMLRDHIVIFFDDEIALPKSPDGRTSDPFTLTPKIAGQFRVGSNFVAFKAKTGFPPREIVQVDLHPGLCGAKGRRISPRQRTLTFATFTFEPVQIWNMEDKPEITVFGIEFPMPVSYQELRKHVLVRSDGGAAIPFEIAVPKGPTNRWRLTLEKNNTWPIKIVVTKGLPDAGGKLTMARDATFTYRTSLTPSPLVITELRWIRSDDAPQEFVVTFSAPVSSEELKKHLVVTDLINHTTAPIHLATTGELNYHRLALDLKNPEDVKISVEVSQGLFSIEKTFLEKSYTTRLEHKGEPLRIEWHRWEIAGQAGPHLLLQFNRPVNLRELQEHLEVNPPVSNLRIERQSQFHVYGDWKSDEFYQIRITAGLEYGKNLTLDKPLVAGSRSPKGRPYIALTPPEKYYIPRSNEFALAIESRNIDKVNLTLHRMFPSNIAVALSDINDGKGGRSFEEEWSEQIATMDLDLANERDQLARTPLTAEELFPKNRKGVFCLRVTTPDEQFLTKVVLLTNIGLFAHWQDNELVLFAHDLYSLAPLPGASIMIYSTKNQLLAKGKTDERGIVHLKDFNTARGVPRVAVVEQGSDYTFLELKSRLDESQGQFDEATSEYDRKNYEAFLYADRNLYRPGEPVHLRWIVRRDYGEVTPNIPLLVSIIKPNGQTLLSQPTVLSKWGTGGLDLATQKAYPTGRYEARLSVPGGESPIGTYEFHLEEFVPNRIKASIALPETCWVANDECEIRVHAQHLFGAPASGRKCQATVLLRREAWKPANWREFRFENDSQYTPGSVPCGEQTTDASGTAVIQFTYRAPAEVTFPLKATVIGRVFELGGRGVTARADAMVFPSDICLGIAAAPDAGKKGIEVRVAAVNVDETSSDLKAVLVTLERQVWNYYVRRYYGYHQAHWSESFQKVETREVALTDGKGSISFPLSEYGYYRVKVHSPATPQYSTLSFYSYGGACEIYETARPSLIKVTLDKPSYQIGDEAEVRIESPFDGKGIVVLQGGEIQKMIPVEIEKNVGRAHFTVTRQQFPNVWVEATVIHKVEQGRKQVYPFSSFAAVNVKVRDPQRELKVAFRNLPKEIRPQTDARIEVETRNAEGDLIEAELTLAAVDEGIHSITGYPNPDPHGWLSRSRRPDCRFAYYYDKVAYDFEKPAAGGDQAEAEVGKRLGAVGENWIKPVALWSGVVHTGKNGRASIQMKVPEFNGQLRLVVVSCSMKALGARSESLLVRRPYILQTSMPRFLLPGDSAQCHAVIYNHTDSPCKVHLAWTFGGVFREGGGSRDLDIAPHGESDCPVDLSVGAAMGQGEIRWEAVVRDANGRELERLKEVAPLPVRAPAAYQSDYELKVLKPGESKTFRNVKFRDDDQAEIALTVGANPMLRLQKALEYVVGYPYGCVEQTTSRLMPMYLLRKVNALTKLALAEGSSVDEYIRAGIARLFSMQTPSGGLGFWPGATDPYPYGSVYALHFLTLAKNGREYELPAESIQALQKYVRGVAADWTNVSPSGMYLRAYAVYVLALGGDLEAIQQIDRFDDLTLPQTARFLLAAALAQNTKDPERISLYLTSKPSQPYAVRERDATLISDIRNTAIELLALRQMGGKPELIVEKVNRLVAFLENQHYGTTQETAFIITALAGYLADVAGQIDEAGARIIASGQETQLRGPETYRRTLQGKGAEFTVANTGKMDLIVNATTRGVPERPDLSAAGNGVTVRRTFYTQQKARASSSTFEQTTGYIVALEIACDDTVNNLIVADLLPAGLEIENPRLNPDAIPGHAFAGAVTPSYLEVRDDRLVLAFNALAKGSHAFYYIVNAVTPGKFQYPAVQAECMYDASIHGHSAASSIEIKGMR
jgi:hypothetical protein